MRSPHIKTINVHELKQQLEGASPFFLIDVRELDEWNSGRLDGATHIPKDHIDSKIEKLVAKNTPICLYCKGGVRSFYAAEHLLNLGYQELYSLDGGIMEWANAGYTVVR